MGLYGTGTGIVIWYNETSGQGELLNLVDGDPVLALSGADMTLSGTLTVSAGGVLTWAGGKGRADNEGIEHVEDASNFWKVKPDNDVFLHVYAGQSGNAILAEAPTEETTAVGGWSYGENGIGVTGLASGSGGIGVRSQVSGSGGIGILAAVGGSATTALQISGGIVDGGSQRYTAMGDATAATDGLNRQTGDGRYSTIASGRRWRRWFDA